ncbi:hypothetical protein MIND_01324100 [Mycena indigotica]|uniref:Potassium channel domain-containing protein n=1 Tax=Mycena indigotica TaxID=2126181 RepID=A0A8H6VWJ7_9AGAR|nr:uncharacterized protein MIND_01324100 [Mycena indigotica]KAF7290829.1 hypothetical protein MIND_01324100 [Mycena indigotica]
MNDPGLEQPIQNSYDNAAGKLKDRLPSQEPKGNGVRAAFRRELQQDEQEEEVGFFQPKRWWFTSTMFPLIAGTFGPLANFFSACALSQPWRQHSTDGSEILDPEWLNGVVGLSLGCSIIANAFLLANFGHLLRYSYAQPFTICFWYLASILLIIPLGMTDTTLSVAEVHTMTQAYYYAIISATIYMILPTLLVLNAIGAYIFHAYPASFNPLTIPQRTLMLQTIAWVLYMAAGAAVFSRLEGWSYLDGVYWADYTLLTIGLGSDFPPQTHASRALLIPFAVGGIILIGLVIGSIRGLVLERGRVKIVHRTVAKERRKWISRQNEPDAGWKREEWEVMRRIQRRAETVHKYSALGSSLLAFFVLWFLGAMVFYLAEGPQQSWTYFESLYFSYTSLLTIGYGDFYPISNAGKPFFVIWSLLAVPTVTILISNVGDVLVGWIRGGLMWTVLPSGERKQQDTDEGTQRMGTDVERLGNAVEQSEEQRGQGGGLAARLAREVGRLARDAASKSDVDYAWEDWEKWLGLLGEGKGGEKTGEWTWLGEDGPLLSNVSETEWILEKLCERLEEEIRSH